MNITKNVKKVILMNKIKISELPAGMIIWRKNTILGITKATLPLKYYDYYCTKIIGNHLDYAIVEKVGNNED